MNILYILAFCVLVIPFIILDIIKNKSFRKFRPLLHALLGSLVVITCINLLAGFKSERIKEDINQGQIVNLWPLSENSYINDIAYQENLKNTSQEKSFFIYQIILGSISLLGFILFFTCSGPIEDEGKVYSKTALKFYLGAYSLLLNIGPFALTVHYLLLK